MFEKFRGNLRGVLEYIPLIFALGFIVGFDSYTTLLGCLIVSLVFAFSKSNYPAICTVSIGYIALLGSANSYLDDRYSTLFALMFLSGIFMVIYSFLAKYKPFEINFSKDAASGFYSGCNMAILVLCLPLCFGNKTFSSLGLIQYSPAGFFSNVKISAIIISLCAGVIYYKLSKNKRKLPCAFISVILAGIINFIYKLDCACINLGSGFFKPFPAGDFGNTACLFCLSIIICLFLIAQTKSVRKFLKTENSLSEDYFWVGMGNSISSIFGSPGGGISPLTYKKDQNNLYGVIFSILIILILLLTFKYYSVHIPIAACCSILILKCLRVLKVEFALQKNKSSLLQFIFLLCFLTSLYNIIIGAILTAIITVLRRIK